MSTELVNHLEVLFNKSIELLQYPDTVERVVIAELNFYIESRINPFISRYTSISYNGEYISGIVSEHLNSDEELIKKMYKNYSNIYRCGSLVIFNGQEHKIQDLKEPDYFFNIELLNDEFITKCIKLLCTSLFDNMRYSYIKPMLYLETWKQLHD